MRRTSDKHKQIDGPAWDFIDKHCPGAHAAWMRDLGLPDREFIVGITGKPSRAVAWSKDWFTLPELLRQSFVYQDGTWRARK